jgi:hypothetical protein
MAKASKRVFNLTEAESKFKESVRIFKKPRKDWDGKKKPKKESDPDEVLPAPKLIIRKSQLAPELRKFRYTCQNCWGDYSDWLKHEQVCKGAKAIARLPCSFCGEPRSLFDDDNGLHRHDLWNKPKPEETEYIPGKGSWCRHCGLKEPKSDHYCASMYREELSTMISDFNCRQFKKQDDSWVTRKKFNWEKEIWDYLKEYKKELKEKQKIIDEINEPDPVFIGEFPPTPQIGDDWD